MRIRRMRSVGRDIALLFCLALVQSTADAQNQNCEVIPPTSMEVSRLTLVEKGRKFAKEHGLDRVLVDGRTPALSEVEIEQLGRDHNLSDLRMLLGGLATEIHDVEPIRLCHSNVVGEGVEYTRTSPKDGQVGVVHGERVEGSIFIGNKEVVHRISKTKKGDFTPLIVGDLPPLIGAGDSPLALYADLWGNKDNASWLLSKGVKVNFTDVFHLVPLHWAASSQDVGGAELLVSRGADVKFKEGADDPHWNQHRTPLHFAAHSCNVGVTRLLLSHGADANARDSMFADGTPFGATPMNDMQQSWAESREWGEDENTPACKNTVLVLQQHGGAR